MFVSMKMCVRVTIIYMCFCYYGVVVYKVSILASLPFRLMFASGAHIEHDTQCTGLFGLCPIIRLTPLAYWKVDVTQLAVKNQTV